MKIMFGNNKSYQLCNSFQVPGASHTLSQIIFPRLLCSQDIHFTECLYHSPFPKLPAPDKHLFTVSMSATFFLCLMPCLDASQCTFQAVDAEKFSTALPSCAFDHIYSIKAIKISLPSLHPIFPLPLQQLSLPACFKFK